VPNRRRRRHRPPGGGALGLPKYIEELSRHALPHPRRHLTVDLGKMRLLRVEGHRDMARSLAGPAWAHSGRRSAPCAGRSCVVAGRHTPPLRDTPRRWIWISQERAAGAESRSSGDRQERRKEA